MNNSTPLHEKTPKKTGRGTAYLLFGVGAIPILLAFFMYFSGTLIPQGRTNNGTLILPPLDIKDWGLTSNLPVTVEDEDSKWRLIVLGQGACREVCQEALFKIRQVNKALGREAGRVEHGYIELNSALDVELSRLIKQEYPNLLISFGDKNRAIYSIDQKLTGSEVLENSYIFIMDPHGNIMMYYTPENVGRDILDDMKKLLKVSKIG